MIDQITKALNENHRISAWKIFKTEQRSHQLYGILGKREALRIIRKTAYHITIFTNTTANNGDNSQGSTTFMISPGQTGIEDRIATAVRLADKQANPPYSLVRPGMKYPDFCAIDTEIRDNPTDVLMQLDRQLEHIAASEKNIEVSSSEFFLNYTKNRLLNSEGLDCAEDSTDILWEVVLLHSNNSMETEFWRMVSRKSLASFDMENNFRQFAGYARDAARAEVPASGACPVVITGDDLHILFAFFKHHASASAVFHGQSLFKPGENVLNSDPHGDRLTILSNAVHCPGSASYHFDDDGLPGKRVPIIDNGILTRYWASKQYADYLNMEPTGHFANFEIPPGTTDWDELLHDSGRVILVLMFSTFDPQPISGDFMGEIRVGYEYRADGTVVPLRGGSVSGNIREALTNCHFSKETATFKNYFGPRGIRFESAQIAGK